MSALPPWEVSTTTVIPAKAGRSRDGTFIQKGRGMPARYGFPRSAGGNVRRTKGAHCIGE